MKVGLIGEKLGHSFSKPIHESIADYTYDVMPLSREEFPLFMEAKNFDAINVTIPYKEMVIPYCDYVDPKAAEIGAVNAIKNVEGKLHATNTDFDGLKWMIENHFDIGGKVVAICGSGGTANTAKAVAADGGAACLFTVGRTKAHADLTYEEAYGEHSDCEMLINTTPCGMYPDNDSVPVDLRDYPCLEAVLDVVYNPLVTRLVADARKRGIPAEGGL